MDSNLYLVAKLTSEIINSSLTKEDKSLLLRNIDKLDLKMLKELNDFINRNPNNIYLLIEIIKEKINFFKNKNENNLHKAIELEEKLLKLIE